MKQDFSTILRITMFSYRIHRNRKSKSIKITILTNREVLVTAPSRAPKFVIDAFVQSKSPWIEDHLKNLPDYVYTDDHYRVHKAQARKTLQSKLDTWAHIMGLSYNRLAIRNSRTRWGSCSSKRNINLSYRLVFLEKALQDYVIIHELAHLVHMNHSSDFWKLVGQYCPECRSLRRRLSSQ